MKVLQITILYILVCYGLADTTKECIKVFSRSNSPALHLPLDNSAQWSCWFQARKPKSTVIIELRDIAISASPESFKFTTGGTGDWHKLTVVQPGRAVQVDGFRKSLRKHTTINLLAIQTTEDILWRTCAEEKGISLSLISSYNNSSVISSQRNSISTLESQGNLRRVNSYPKGSPNLNHYANTGKYYSYVEVDKDVEHYI
ncbi:unnamed protein product [Meganyctiphanes norvegica]|uniref:CUB domain-containing protein n=1 Tax=Meganyctiphanes norvegica TaxID=48144 RepID=A0AAV2QUN9_MEGNR